MSGVNPKPQRVLLAVLLITLAVFGMLVAGLTWQLRSRLREEALRREAEAMDSVALLELGNAMRNARSPMVDPFDELMAAVMETSRLRGVLAVQLFDGSGELRAAEPVGTGESEAARWWPVEPTFAEARFQPQGTLETVYGFPSVAGAARVPLLEVMVPLRSSPDSTVLGVARYWIDGTSLASEFARTNRRLWAQAGAAYAGGMFIILLVIGWALRQLSAANRRLEERSADLARANQELDFAARTSAIGAISAHLIHGLKNPLSGLEGFVAESAPESAGGARGEAWRTAVETTKRLRNLVSEVVDVLRDEATGEADYPVPVQEIIGIIQARLASAAKRAGVTIEAPPQPRELAVLGRTANLAQLILENLVTNAVESSLPGQRVSVTAGEVDTKVEIVVSDHGPGLPPHVRRQIFRPLRSGKPAGGGIGLAISYQLARHAGGSLELVRTGDDGTVFRLVLPAASAV